MEDWEKILEGHYRNFQDFGEYIGLEIVGFKFHPFNNPTNINSKLETAGYFIKNSLSGMLSDDGDTEYVPIEFWKKEFFEKGRNFHEIHGNLYDYKRGFHKSYTDSNSVPLLSKDMALKMLEHYLKELSKWQIIVDELTTRIESNFYPDVIEDKPDPFWAHLVEKYNK